MAGGAKASLMHHFCTYFDHRYLLRGLALHHSLGSHAGDFVLWVLCLDDPCHDILRRLQIPRLKLIRLQDFESADEQLVKAKRTRSTIEYYFTCTPSLPLFILRQNPSVDRITYLDSDLYFFGSIEPIFSEMQNCSISIIPHRFSPYLRDRSACGVYNVGWLSFRNDARGRECLLWWRDRCLEWCYDRVEGDKFADQKYLDDWPTRFEGVSIIQHKGANVAPWNLANYRIRLKHQNIQIDEDPLVFFHFHGFRRIGRSVFKAGLAAYHVRPGQAVLRGIYEPYIKTLAELETKTRPFLCESFSSENIRPNSRLSPLSGGNWVKQTLVWDVLKFARDMWFGEYVLLLNGRLWCL